MTLDRQLFDIIRCPACRGTFAEPAGAAPEELHCTGCGNAYPVRNGVPVLLVEEARPGSDAAPRPAQVD